MNDKERELFEKAYREIYSHRGVNNDYYLRRNTLDLEGYAEYETNVDWQLWQAARKLSTTPDGWVSVPKEPTDAMENAGALFLYEPNYPSDIERIWGAMLEAAPTTPKGGDDEAT